MSHDDKPFVPFCNRHQCDMEKIGGARYVLDMVGGPRDGRYARYFRCPYGDAWQTGPYRMSRRQARWESTALYRWLRRFTHPRLKIIPLDALSVTEDV